MLGGAVLVWNGTAERHAGDLVVAGAGALDAPRLRFSSSALVQVELTPGASSLLCPRGLTACAVCPLIFVCFVINRY